MVRLKAYLNTLLLPNIFGELAVPTEANGRFSMLLLRLLNDRTVVLGYNEDEITKLFAGRKERIGINEFGVTDEVTSNSSDLGRQVAVVASGAGGIRLSLAEELIARGASVPLVNIAEAPVAKTVEQNGRVEPTCDVTEPVNADATIQQVVKDYRDIDILISNAVSAQQGPLLHFDADCFYYSLDLNFWRHPYVAHAVFRVLVVHRNCGVFVFKVSRRAVCLSPQFGEYETPKAVLMALVRLYAAVHSKNSFRSSSVNADRIRTGLMTIVMRKMRIKRRGLIPDQSIHGKLVKRQVTGKAETFVFLARARTSTGALMTANNGNMVAMMR